jgi:hypothetical protein
MACLDLTRSELGNNRIKESGLSSLLSAKLRLFAQRDIPSRQIFIQKLLLLDFVKIIQLDLNLLRKQRQHNGAPPQILQANPLSDQMVALDPGKKSAGTGRRAFVHFGQLEAVVGGLEESVHGEDAEGEQLEEVEG